MKIFGIGTDIVNISRMEKSLKKKVTLLKIESFLKMKLDTVRKKRNLPNFLPKDLLQKRL